MEDLVSDSKIAFEKVRAKGQVPVTALMYHALSQVDRDQETELGEATLTRFNQRLADAARLLGETPLLSNPIDRADAFHYLLTTIHAAIDHSVLQTDTTEPMFSPIMPTYRVDWGARNPDGVYRRATISADRTYRIHGTLGNAKYFSFDFVGADYNSDVGYGVDLDDLRPDGDGRFEFVLGGSERPGAWYPMHPGIQAVTVREFFDDWATAKRAVLRIDCIDDDILTRTESAPRPEHSAAWVAAEFEILGDWIYEAGVRFFLGEWHSGEKAESTRNRFNPFYRTETKRPTVSRCCWDLANDEALVLEFPDPGAHYWGVQMSSMLVHTLDFANRLTTINSAQARLSDDGVFRLVVSHRDPGTYNWLDTTGLSHGDLMLRIHKAQRLEPPRTTVTKFANLRTIIPDAGTLPPQERRKQIAERREGAARLYCD